MFGLHKKATYAPIAFFVFNRIDHPRMVIESLQKNTEAKYTDLYIFSDGPRFIDDDDRVTTLRKYLKTITGFRSVRIYERKTNYGLAINLIDGIGRVLESHDRVIVLEDDIVVNTNFLSFMNQCLTKYKNNHDIFTIQATTGDPRGGADVICRKQPNCWGWAIWRDRWDLFQRNLSKSFLELNDNYMDLRTKLNNNNSVNISWQVDANLDGRRSTWDVYLNFTSIKYNKLNIYPRYQIIKNVGQDGTGVHGNVCATENMNTDWNTKNFVLPTHPTEQILGKEPDKFVTGYNDNMLNNLKNAKYRQFILSPALNKQIDEIRENNLFIPIGEFCLPRVLLTYACLKKHKSDGENTYPFDLAFHNDFNRVLDILKSQFDNFYDGLTFDNKTHMWHSADNKIRYNHDLDKSADEFRERYDKRINNFLADVNTDKQLWFVYATDNTRITQANLDDMFLTLVKYNPRAKLLVLSMRPNKKIHTDDNIKVITQEFVLGADWLNELLVTPHGRKFFDNLAHKIIDTVSAK